MRQYFNDCLEKSRFSRRKVFLRQITHSCGVYGGWFFVAVRHFVVLSRSGHHTANACFSLKKLRFFALQHNCRCIASRLFLIQPAVFPIRQETREYDGGTECGWYIMGMSLSHRRNVRLAYVILRGSRCAVEAVGFVTV